MAEFYRTDLATNELSLAALNNIALNEGGIVGGIGFGYACRGNNPPDRHGYGFRWINTRGMGNHGDMVLVPRSAHAAEWLRQGRIKKWMAKFRLSYVEADRLFDASRGVMFGREEGVIAYALETQNHPAWGAFPGVGNGVWDWAERWAMPEANISAPRLEGCAELVKNLKKK